MRKVIFSLIVANGMLTIMSPVVAHHGHGLYNFAESISLRGVVKRVRWVNPHVHFEVETSQPNGERTVWIVDAEPPALMSKFGWRSDSLAPGDLVTITGIPARNPERKIASGVSAITADGNHLWISGATPYDELAKDLANPFYADGLSGTWSTRFNAEAVVTYFHREPSDSLTDEGNQALESQSEILTPGSECIPNPVPYTMLVPISSEIEIGETITRIWFEGDQGLVERVVHMNVDSHDDASYSNQGHSIGRWEGDVLVVDTTHFEVHEYGHGRGIPSSPEKHLVERLELSPDRSSLSYTFWVEDPRYLAEPATATIELLYRPDLEILDIPCDLESARRYLEE